MVSCHRVDLHIGTGTETESEFTRVGIGDGESLEHGVEFGGEVGHLYPSVFAIDGTFNHKGRVAAAAHEGTDAAVAGTFLGRERQHLATLNAQRRGHKIVERTAATHQVFDIEARHSSTCTVVLLLIGRALLYHASTVYLPAFSKPPVRQFIVVETLIHLFRRYRLSLDVNSNKQK